MSIDSSIASQFSRLFSRDAGAALAKAPVQEAEQKLAIPATRAATAAAAKKVTPASYKTAVDALNRRVANDVRMQGPLAKGPYRMEANDQAIFRAQPTPTAKGTVVMFHGYTAGPWQYKELADKLYNDGYNVYAPRLPGHGYTEPNGQITNAGFVHAADRGRYEGYVEARYQEAKALGAPVYTLGLSGGTNLALRTAEKHPEVKGVFAMAPFLGPNKPNGYLYSTLRFLDKITFGGFGRIMDLVPEEKNGMADAKSIVPHNESTFGEALAIEEVGANIKNVAAPIQFVTTHGDQLSGTDLVKPLFDRTGGASKNGWFHFSAEDKVPHPMISPLQDKSPGEADKLDQMVLDFLHGQRTMRRPEGMS